MDDFIVPKGIIYLIRSSPIRSGSRSKSLPKPYHGTSGCWVEGSTEGSGQPVDIRENCSGLRKLRAVQG